MISLGPATSSRRCHCCSSKQQAWQAPAFLFQQAPGFLFQQAPAFLFQQAPAFLFQQAPAFLVQQAPAFLSNKLRCSFPTSSDVPFQQAPKFLSKYGSRDKVQPTVSTLLLIVVAIRRLEKGSAEIGNWVIPNFFNMQSPFQRCCWLLLWSETRNAAAIGNSESKVVFPWKGCLFDRKFSVMSSCDGADC
jgi:hypothetical protein